MKHSSIRLTRQCFISLRVFSFEISISDLFGLFISVDQWQRGLSRPVTAARVHPAAAMATEQASRKHRRVTGVKRAPKALRKGLSQRQSQGRLRTADYKRQRTQQRRRRHGRTGARGRRGGEGAWANVWQSVKQLFHHALGRAEDADAYGDGDGDGGRSSFSEMSGGDPREEESHCDEDATKSSVDTMLENMSVDKDKDSKHDEEAKFYRERVDVLESQLSLLKKKLKYSREKNILYKSLLDEANIGTTYLESRRHIRNLAKDNIKPRDELPPSPERKVFPLVTSSPIRNVTGTTNGATMGPPSSALNHTTANADQQPLAPPPPLKNYYNKYPTIPTTELLQKKDADKQ